MEPEKFEEQMKLLFDWDYTPVTIDTLLRAITEGAELPPRPVIITFDDGHLDNYTTAFPIMQKFGFTGVLYIVGNYMGTDGYMTAAQIREMVMAGWEGANWQACRAARARSEGKPAAVKRPGRPARVLRR